MMLLLFLCQVKLVAQDLKKQGHKLLTDGLDDGMGGGSSEDDEDDDDGMGGGAYRDPLAPDTPGGDRSNTTKSGGGGGAGESESDEGEAEDQAEGNDEDGSLAVRRKTKEASTYESDDEGAEDNDGDHGGGGSDGESDDDDDGGSGAAKKKQQQLKKKGAGGSKGAAAAQKKTTTPRAVSVGFAKTAADSKSDGTFQCALFAPARAGRVLMVRLAELAAAATVVRAVAGIEKAHVVERELVLHSPFGAAGKADRWALFTEGCNFHTLWALEAASGKAPSEDLLDLNRLGSNDIAAILEAYGVEAARRAVVKEVQGVFGVYGIDVDDRHVGLIADAMTFGGGFRPFNRLGIGAASSSPFLHMSFETTASFLTAAAVSGEPDALASPSARLVMGQLAKQGTGAFEVRADLKPATAAGAARHAVSLPS
jgi:DNA-directed RNA polymerase I subunit RPA1